MTRIDSPEPPQANPPVRRGDAPRPQGPLAFVAASLRMAWRWLTRMRTALYLLGVLGLLTLLATLVPQEPNVPWTVRDWRSGEAGPGTFVSGAIDLIGGYDVYGSAIFLALLLLLFTSLTACLIPRFRALWRLWGRSQPPVTRHLGTQEQVAAFTVDVRADAVLAEADALLRTRRWRVRDRAGDDVVAQVAGEKGHVLREAGSLVFHTSFYVLLVAIVIGQLFGFVGQVGVVEGQDWAETEVGYWTKEPGRWWGAEDHRGFVLALDRFNIDWHRDVRFGGQPSLFQSEVTITEADGTTYSDTVGGNDPLVIEGMKVHQLDWGYAPRVVIEVDGEVVHDGFLTLSQDDTGFWQGAAKAPAAEPDVGLEITLIPYAPDREDGPVVTGAPWADAPLLGLREFRGDLQLTAAQNVNRLDTTLMEESGVGALRPGGTFELADGVVVRFPELRRWVGFQISYRPTVGWLLFGASLVLIGLIPALYAYRRRLWVGAKPTADGRTLVTVAGRAFQRPHAFEDEHAEIVRQLERRLAQRAGADHRSDDETPTEVVPR